MTHEVIMAGFGGQGIMLIGTLMTYAGMEEKKAVSWIPSYGPEMRGGTANCTVCVSDEEIASPIVVEPTSLIVMNGPSFEKFYPLVAKGGCVIVNSSLIHHENTRDDVRVFRIPANDEAKQLGSERVANMICLGALIAAEKIVSLETVKRVLPKVIHERHYNLLPLNEKALQRGYDLVMSEISGQNK